MSLVGRIGKLEKGFNSADQPLRIDDMAPLLTAMYELSDSVDSTEYDRLAAIFAENFHIQVVELERQVQAHRKERV